MSAAEHYAFVLFEAELALWGDHPATWNALDGWLDSLPRDLSPHSPSTQSGE